MDSVFRLKPWLAPLFAIAGKEGKSTEVSRCSRQSSVVQPIVRSRQSERVQGLADDLMTED